MLRRLVLLIALTLPFAAFGKSMPPPFKEIEMKEIPAPPADQAQIILLEPINKIQGLFPIGIFKIDGDQRTLLNVSSWRSKSILLLPPGKHILMASPGGIGHFMEANVEAGKRYYVLLRFIYAQGMQLRPLRPSGTSEYRVDGPKFPEWMKQTSRWVEKSETDAQPYFDAWAEQLNKAQENALVAWQAKTAEEVAELTLNVEDAVAK